MKKRIVEKWVESYCKIVNHELGQDRAHIDIGNLTDNDQ